MTRLIAYTLCALLLGVSTAHAQPVDERAVAAKQHYETGMAHFQLEEWDRAITEWEEGFRQKPVPQFLYNIAQANRLSKRYEKALSFYQKYLRMDPKAVNKSEVDRHIATLTRLVAEQQKASSAPPIGPREPAPQPVVRPEPVRPAPQPVVRPEPVRPAPQPVVTPEPVKPQPVVTPEPARADLTVTATKDTRPITKKAWFWGVIGGAAALVVAGVVVGVVLGTADNTKILTAARF